MRSRRSERGEGNFGCIFGLILVVLALFVAYKVIPVKVKNAALRQVIVDEAKSAGTHSDVQIKETILRQAATDKLPVTDENITIKRSPNEISVDVEYTVAIDFPGKVWNWHIEHHVSNPIF
jgi:hypothetical protein